MNPQKQLDIATLAYSGKEPCIYWRERGFGIRVYPGGKKSFVLSYRASGYKRLLTLGQFPELPLHKAEDMAAAYRLQISEGADPVAERRFQSDALRAMPTPQVTASKSVSALCETYLALHASKKKSGDSDRQLIERFILQSWAKLKAEAVTRSHVAMLHAQVSKKTPTQANRLLAIIKTMWNKARIWGIVPDNHPNPAYGVGMNKETPRERFVTEEELPRLVAAIEQEPDVRVRAALWLFLLTGARKSELLEAKWEDVDLQRQELRIPRPKQGKPHVYPLSGRALEVLGRLPRFNGNPYVIPGDKEGAHLVNIDKPWNRVRARSGLTDVRLHDLRRSVGSWLAASGHSLLQIGKVLGHSSPRTTQIYARLTDDAPRVALETHATRLIEVLRNADERSSCTEKPSGPPAD